MEVLLCQGTTLTARQSAGDVALIAVEYFRRAAPIAVSRLLEIAETATADVQRQIT